MPRQARVVADGVPHHITQRGNNRQEVFLLDEDRRFYLESLRLQARRHGVRLLGYCLMTNHVHLVAVPERLDGLALALGAAPRPSARLGVQHAMPAASTAATGAADTCGKTASTPVRWDRRICGAPCSMWI